MRRLFVSAFFWAALAHADFNAERWQSRMPLRLTPGSVISELVLGPEVFRHSRARLSDLRIVRDGVEVAYLLRRLAGDLQENERAVVILDKSWTAGKGVQAVLDLRGQTEHNRLRIVTGKHNFKQAVTVETSADGNEWAMVLGDGVIFDISRPGTIVSDLTVTYPTSTRRYVRITIPDWSDPAFLESAWLAERRETDATRDGVAVLVPMITEHSDARTTEMLFDLGFEGYPCDKLALQVAPGLFSRSVEVATGNDPKHLITQGGFAIDRTSSSEHTVVEWNETWDRYVRLTVFNADDAPLAFGRATASAIRRVLQFPSKDAGTYWLYLDNSEAHAPSYDFGRVEEITLGTAATVGAAGPNPAFQPKRAPFSERKPWILNLVLGLAVAVMAFVTFRFARRVTAAKG